MLPSARPAILVSLYAASLLAAQQKPPAPPESHEPQAPPATGETAAPRQELTDAERIARLQRAIEQSRKELAEARAKLADPQGEYAKAEAKFLALDKELEARKKELQELQQQGGGQQAGELGRQIAALQQHWKLARERFDLAIQERKTLQEQIATLQQKIRQDRQTLARLLAPPSTRPAAAGQPPASAPAAPAAPAGARQTAEAPPSGLNVPGLTPGRPAAEQGARPQQPAEQPGQEVIAARKEVQAKAAAAETAKQEVQSISARMAQVRRQIEMEKALLETARRKAANAEETRRTLAEQLQQRSAAGAPRAEIQALWAEIAQARRRARAAQAEVDTHVDRIDRSQEELAQLQQERIAALQHQAAAQAEAERAQKKLARLQNPFAPRNLAQWLLDHGPQIVGIVVAMLVLLWLARVLEGRLVRLIAGRGGPGSAEDRENRARTLVSVFHNTASVVVVIGGILMILSELGLPIVPLMGGAAVVGLAVAFGAQNLVRDYFTGFIILLENQYGINDVIKVAGVAGLVERITLRVTVLRDLEGIVHFVPNGQIATVSNLTHGWSRVVLDIGVAYKEDVDHVMQVISQAGKQVRQNPNYRHLMLEDLEVLGVDAFTDSAVVIKAIVKTRPLHQWTVKRAIMRHLKKRFDELGIEIPFPHRTILHRYEREPQPAPPGADAQPSLPRRRP